MTPVFSALEKPVAIDFVDMPETLRGKYQYFTQASLLRTQALGYLKPPTPLSKAVIECVQQYLVPRRYMGDRHADMRPRAHAEARSGQS